MREEPEGKVMSSIFDRLTWSCKSTIGASYRRFVSKPPKPPSFTVGTGARPWRHVSFASWLEVRLCWQRTQEWVCEATAAGSESALRRAEGTHLRTTRDQLQHQQVPSGKVVHPRGSSSSAARISEDVSTSALRGGKTEKRSSSKFLISYFFTLPQS